MKSAHTVGTLESSLYEQLASHLRDGASVIVNVCEFTHLLIKNSSSCAVFIMINMY